MQLSHIGLEPLRIADINEKLEGVIVWRPYGWLCRMVLDRVTGSEFDELEGLVKVSESVWFSDCSAQQDYDCGRGIVWIEIRDRDYIEEFVRRGALRDSRIMLELGRSLLARLELQLQQRRTQRR